jgi:hypothetical protein
MQKLSLNVDDLTVESFATEEKHANKRTVLGHEQVIDDSQGGDLAKSMCFGTCWDNNTCADTCAETCAATCPISCHNTACVAFCGGGGGDISNAQTCDGCGDNTGGWGTNTSVSPCGQTS